MKDRTVNIIYLCKRYEIGYVPKKIAEYMAEDCDCPIKMYTDEVVFKTIQSAFLDYIFNVDKKYVMDLMYNFFETVPIDYSYKTLYRMIWALSLAQIAENNLSTGDWDYIGGFHETVFMAKTQKMIEESVEDGKN